MAARLLPLGALPDAPPLRSLHSRTLCYPSAAMKSAIHPEYVVAKVHCSCGNEFMTRSTKAEIRVEVCSNCHPFYTGKQRAISVAGRVDRFNKKYNIVK